MFAATSSTEAFLQKPLMKTVACARGDLSSSAPPSSVRDISVLAYLTMIVLFVAMSWSVLDYKQRLCPLRPESKGQETDWWYRLQGPFSGRILRKDGGYLADWNQRGHSLQGFLGTFLFLAAPAFLVGQRLTLNTTMPTTFQGRPGVTGNRFWYPIWMLLLGLGAAGCSSIYWITNLNKRTLPKYDDGKNFGASSYGNNHRDFFVGQLAGLVGGIVLLVVTLSTGARGRSQICTNMRVLLPFLALTGIITLVCYILGVTNLQSSAGQPVCKLEEASTLCTQVRMCRSTDNDDCTLEALDKRCPMLY